MLPIIIHTIVAVLYVLLNSWLFLSVVLASITFIAIKLLCELTSPQPKRKPVANDKAQSAQ